MRTCWDWGDSWCNVSCLSFELGLVSLVGHQSSSIRSTCCNMNLHRVPSVGMPRKRVDSTFSDGSCRHAVFFFSLLWVFPFLAFFPYCFSFLFWWVFPLLPLCGQYIGWCLNQHTPIGGNLWNRWDVTVGGPYMPCMLLPKLLEHVYECLRHSKPRGLFSSFFSMVGFLLFHACWLIWLLLWYLNHW